MKSFFYKKWPHYPESQYDGTVTKAQNFLINYLRDKNLEKSMKKDVCHISVQCLSVKKQMLCLENMCNHCLRLWKGEVSCRTFHNIQMTTFIIKTNLVYNKVMACASVL